MSSCDNFSENSWKRDLCRNCQRPRQDHACVTGYHSDETHQAGALDSANTSRRCRGGSQPSSPRLLAQTVTAEKANAKEHAATTRSRIPCTVELQRAYAEEAKPALQQQQGPQSEGFRTTQSVTTLSQSKNAATPPSARSPKQHCQTMANLRKSLGPPPSIPHVAIGDQRNFLQTAEPKCVHSSQKDLSAALPALKMAETSSGADSRFSSMSEGKHARRQGRHQPLMQMPNSPRFTGLTEQPQPQVTEMQSSGLDYEHIYAEISECGAAMQAQSATSSPRGRTAVSPRQIGPSSQKSSSPASKDSSDQRQGKAKMALFKNLFKKGKKEQAEPKPGSAYVNEWVSQSASSDGADDTEKNEDANRAMQGVWPYDPKADFSKTQSDEPQEAVDYEDGPPVIFDERSLTELIVEAERQRVGARKSNSNKIEDQSASNNNSDLYDLPWFDSTFTIQNLLKQVEINSTEPQAEERRIEALDGPAATPSQTKKSSTAPQAEERRIEAPGGPAVNPLQTKKWSTAPQSEERRIEAPGGPAVNPSQTKKWFTAPQAEERRIEASGGPAVNPSQAKESSKTETKGGNETRAMLGDSLLVRSESYLEPKRLTGDIASSNASPSGTENGGGKTDVIKPNSSGNGTANGTVVSNGKANNVHVKEPVVRIRDVSEYEGGLVQKIRDGNISDSAVGRDNGHKSKPAGVGLRGKGGYESDTIVKSREVRADSGEIFVSKVKTTSVRDSKDGVYDRDTPASTSSLPQSQRKGSSSRLSDLSKQSIGENEPAKDQTREVVLHTSNSTTVVMTKDYAQNSKTLQPRKSDPKLTSGEFDGLSSRGKDGSRPTTETARPAAADDSAYAVQQQAPNAAASLQGSKTLHSRRSEASVSADSAGSRRDLGNMTEDDGYYSENRTLLRHSHSRNELTKISQRKENGGSVQLSESGASGTIRRTEKKEGGTAIQQSIVAAAAILDKAPQTPAEGFFHMSAVASDALRKLCEEGRNRTAPIPELVLTRQRMAWDDFSFPNDSPVHSNKYCIFYRATLKNSSTSQLLLMVSLKEPKTTLTARSPYVFGCKPWFEMDVPMRMIPSAFLAANQPSSGLHVQKGINGQDSPLYNDNFGQYDKPWHESSRAAVKSLESSYHAGLLNTEKFQQDPLKCYVTVLPPLPEDAMSLSALLTTLKSPVQDGDSKRQRDVENVFQILLQVVKAITSLFFECNTICNNLKPEDLLLTRQKREPYMIMLAPGNLRKSDMGSGFIVCAQLKKLFEEVATACPSIRSTPGYARLEKLIQCAGDMGDVKAIVKVWETVAWGPSEKEVRTLCLADDREAAFEMWLQVQRLKQLCAMATEAISSFAVPLEQFEKGLFLCAVTGTQLFAVSKMLHAK